MQLHEVELKRKKENSFEPVKNPTTKRNDAIYILVSLPHENSCRTFEKEGDKNFSRGCDISSSLGGV